MIYSDQLRLLADFFADHPDMPTPLLMNKVYVFDKESMLTAAKLPGAKKRYDDNYYNIDVKLADDLIVTFFTAREIVCIVKRTEIVTIPAKKAHTYEKPVEWDCHPLLTPDKGEI